MPSSLKNATASRYRMECGNRTWYGDELHAQTVLNFHLNMLSLSNPDITRYLPRLKITKMQGKVVNFNKGFGTTRKVTLDFGKKKRQSG